MLQTNGFKHAFVFCSVVLLLAATAPGQIFIDFETEDDFATPLVNGQDLSTPPEFGILFDISSGGGLGAAIFDSDPNGPNAGGNDTDLLVDLGNIVIIQNVNEPNQTVSGIFDVPDDHSGGGSVVFDFNFPTEMLSIDLVDINGSAATTVVLTDVGGNTRTYAVPSHWTNDLTVSPNGFDTLDLTTLANQLGEGGSTATASQGLGFDPLNVIQLDVSFSGSGGLDNLTFVPEPAAMMLLFAGGVGLLRRRRSRRA